MKVFGLIGRKLGHSFSAGYFNKKFEREGLEDHTYKLFELSEIEEIPDLFQTPGLQGLNVTIPYKEKVIRYLDELDDSAKRVGAVNVIQLKNGKTKGFNSDYYGFLSSLLDWLGTQRPDALVLGTGGASKAVGIALEDAGIRFQLVSRHPEDQQIGYDQIDQTMLESHHLIINTTPVGMYPETENCPDLPYHLLSAKHFLYDLVYNPETTLFMKKGMDLGARVKNGLDMLYLQAEKSWEFWNR